MPRNSTELQRDGFEGSAVTVRRYVHTWRPEGSRRGRSCRSLGRKQAPPSSPELHPKASVLAVSEDSDELRPKEQVYLERFCELCPEGRMLERVVTRVWSDSEAARRGGAGCLAARKQSDSGAGGICFWAPPGSVGGGGTEWSSWRADQLKPEKADVWPCRVHELLEEESLAHRSPRADDARVQGAADVAYHRLEELLLSGMLATRPEQPPQ